MTRTCHWQWSDSGSDSAAEPESPAPECQSRVDPFRSCGASYGSSLSCGGAALPACGRPGRAGLLVSQLERHWHSTSSSNLNHVFKYTNYVWTSTSLNFKLKLNPMQSESRPPGRVRCQAVPRLPVPAGQWLEVGWHDCDSLSWSPLACKTASDNLSASLPVSSSTSRGCYHCASDSKLEAMAQAYDDWLRDQCRQPPEQRHSAHITA